MTTILTKIKHKAILIEYIQGFVSTRRYILPFLINKDKILLNQLKLFNDILEDNTLSSNFMNNLFSLISDRILFRIISEENVMNDSLYVPEEKEENIFQKIKKRILNIYKNKKIYKETTISTNKLKKYIPNEKEFVLFIMDFLENKNQISLIFPEFNLQKGKNYIINFNSYYEKNKILFEKEAQLFNNDAKSEYDKINRKIIINVAFIGNKNSGKSTTVGHLLYNTGNIEPNIFNEAINTTNAFGISSYKYSWLLDRIWDERTYRKTVIPHIKKFETEKYYFNLIDLPGDFKLKKKYN